jgi:uncharacterized protein (DUF433 family)
VKPKRGTGKPLLPAHEVALLVGGEPVITGTRVPVRTIASLIEMGEKPEALREDYPHIPEEAYPMAALWTHANPRRGRPAALRDTRATHLKPERSLSARYSRPPLP